MIQSTIIFYWRSSINMVFTILSTNGLKIVSNRRQFVCVKGCYSNKASLLCGVPQWSILGPLLFLIYINDLSNVSNILSPIIFADDTTLVLFHPNFNSLIKDVNAGLTAYTTWFRLNKLSLNIKKSNYHFQWQKIILKGFI